jgi:hypothetical protein
LEDKNIMNLGFGDLMADGSVNYKANSNNGGISGFNKVIYFGIFSGYG